MRRVVVTGMGIISSIGNSIDEVKNSLYNATSGIISAPEYKEPVSYTHLDVYKRQVYKQAGLPVKVIAETIDWRKIEDPDGTQVWVHKRNLDSKRTLIIRPSQKGATHVMLYNKNTQNNKVIAKIASGSICEILDSQEG